MCWDVGGVQNIVSLVPARLPPHWALGLFSPLYSHRPRWQLLLYGAFSWAIYTHIYVDICIYMCIYMYVYIYIYVYNTYYIYVYIYLCIHIYVYIYYLYMCVYMHSPLTLTPEAWLDMCPFGMLHGREVKADPLFLNLEPNCWKETWHFVPVSVNLFPCVCVCRPVICSWYFSFRETLLSASGCAAEIVVNRCAIIYLHGPST